MVNLSHKNARLIPKMIINSKILEALLGYPTSVVEGVGDEFISVSD